MKNFLKINLIIFLLLFSYKNCYSQTYVLKQDTIIETVNNIDRKNKSKLNEFAILKRGYLFNKIAETKDSIMLTIIPFKKKNTRLNKQLYNENENAETANKIFIFSKTDLPIKLQKAGTKFGFGTVILPLKIRFGGGNEDEKRYFDFESGLNIGLSFSYKYSTELAKIDKYFIFNLATSSIKINASNTNGFVNSETNASALSPSVGFVFEFENDVQLIVTTGIDYLTGEVGKKWVYRDKPFVGIGIGFSIFKFGEKINNTQP